MADSIKINGKTIDANKCVVFFMFRMASIRSEFHVSEYFCALHIIIIKCTAAFVLMLPMLAWKMVLFKFMRWIQVHLNYLDRFLIKRAKFGANKISAVKKEFFQ